MVDHASRGCEITNHVLRCDVPSHITRLIWAQSRVMQLILGLSRLTQKPFATLVQYLTRNLRALTRPTRRSTLNHIALNVLWPTAI